MTSRVFVAALVVVRARSAGADPDPSWAAGDHATGEWNGVRGDLADRGMTLDASYAAEVFTSVTRAHTAASAAVLGHIDLAITLDTKKLGLWPGGTVYALGQDNRGNGINDDVGSATQISNLEAPPYTQLTEWFLEQTLFDDKVRVRVGRQDANRDFGTPRFGGNFINNNFGMYPTTPLPSYPTTGLGVMVGVQPASWLAAKVALYEGSPMVGGFGLDSAFRKDAGYIVSSQLAATRVYGPAQRNGSTTSVGVWGQRGQLPEQGTADPRTFDTDEGFFVQHDEHVFAHPADANDPTGLTVILRYSWARADRTNIARYAGGSAAWHGLGRRHDDTVGLGAGYFTVALPTGLRDEVFVEAFYKWRVTPFISVQPDLEFYRHPGGDGADAFLLGGRVKLKL